MHRMRPLSTLPSALSRGSREDPGSRESVKAYAAFPSAMMSQCLVTDPYLLQVAEMTGRKGMLARTEHGVQWVERRAEV